MDNEDFTHYHETKFIESLTYIIDKQEIDLSAIEYLQHTLLFLPYNTVIADAWVELLKLMNSHLLQLLEFTEAQEQLINLSNQTDDLRKKYEIYAIILLNYFQNNQFDHAMQWVNNQLELVKDTDHMIFYTRALRTKGTLYHLSGQLSNAEEWYKKAYELNPKLDRYQVKDQNIYALANLYQHYIGDAQSALEYYIQGRKLAHTEDNQEREAFYLDHMGMAEYWLGNYENAIEHHNQALPFLESMDRSLALLFHKVQYAMSLWKLGDYQGVIDALYSVLDLKKQNQDPFSNIWYLLLLSQAAKQGISFDKPAFKEVIEVEIEPYLLLREAKSLAEETRYIPALVYANLFLSNHLMADDPVEAIALISEAKQLAKSNNRYREVDAIKDHVDMIGLDYDTL